MSGTFIKFPRTYEIDDYYFVLILRFIRHEIINHHRSDQIELNMFVSDLEKYHWHTCPQTVIDFGRYCGSVKSYPEFVECLNRVRALLLGFGSRIPPGWKEKLKVTPDDDHVPVHYPVKKVIYWLDCLRRAVDEYKPFIGVTTFPFPPET